MKLAALLCATLLLFNFVQAAPGNIFSAKKPRKPMQATGIIASLPLLPQTLLVPQTPDLEIYTAWLRQKVHQVPQFSKADVQGSGWRLDLTTMLGASSTVREQMAKEDPSKRQYLPLFANGEDKQGWGNPLKTYAMPLDPRYFNPATADTRLSGGRVDQHTFAILGVWHNDPADAFEYFGHGPRVALYGFATALNAPRADSVLPKLDPAQGLSHDLYRVLSVHP